MRKIEVNRGDTRLFTAAVSCHKIISSSLATVLNMAYGKATNRTA